MTYFRNQKQISFLRTLVAVVLSIVILFPFFIMLSTALKEMAEIRQADFHFIPRNPTWNNYLGVLQNSKWALYFRNSFQITLISVVGAVVINSMAGFAFARLTFKGSHLLFMLALLGMMVPSQVIMLPAYVIMKYLPFFGGNNILGQGGSGLLNTSAGLVLAYLSGSFGVFLMRQFMMGFPRDLDDAARVDGLSWFGILFRIYFPLCKPALATMIVLRCTATWNDYMWPLLMTQKEKQYTVQLALSKYSTDSNPEWGMLMAAVTLIILPVIVLFIFLQKYFVAGIVTQGLKG